MASARPQRYPWWEVAAYGLHTGRLQCSPLGRPARVYTGSPNSSRTLAVSREQSHQRSPSAGEDAWIGGFEGFSCILRSKVVDLVAPVY